MPTGADCPSPQDFVSLARGFSPAADLVTPDLVAEWRLQPEGLQVWAGHTLCQSAGLRLVGPDCANLPRLRAACGLSHSTALAGARVCQRLAQSDLTPGTGPISDAAIVVAGLLCLGGPCTGPQRSRSAQSLSQSAGLCILSPGHQPCATLFDSCPHHAILIILPVAACPLLVMRFVVGYITQSETPKG